LSAIQNKLFVVMPRGPRELNPSTSNDGNRLLTGAARPLSYHLLMTTIRRVEVDPAHRTLKKKQDDEAELVFAWFRTKTEDGYGWRYCRRRLRRKLRAIGAYTLAEDTRLKLQGKKVTRKPVPWGETTDGQPSSPGKKRMEAAHAEKAQAEDDVSAPLDSNVEGIVNADTNPSTGYMERGNEAKSRFVAPGMEEKTEWETLSQRLADIRSDPNGNQDEEQRICDVLWTKIQTMLGLTREMEDLWTDRYEKSHLDLMVEDFFGTMASQDAPLQSREDSSAIFSLYLTRKCLIVNRRENLKKNLENTVATLMSGRPDDVNSELESRSKAFMQRLAEALFTYKGRDRFLRDKQAQVPTQRAACVEGKCKRDLFYASKQKATSSCVVPKAILSGGKIRVITLDSYKNMRYAMLNKFMLRQIRRQGWSIAGRSVQEWWDAGGNRLNDYSYVCSGDLKSATDNFNGALADIVIVHLADLFGFNETEVEEMRSFTTKALLKGHGVQNRGQLMGSVLSFPILCLVSLTAWAIGTGFDKKNEDKEGKKLLQALEEEAVGINGDDIVFGTDDRGEGWQEGVAAVWGIVSPGKSLLSKWAFTVNSELWWRSEDAWSAEFEHVGLVRPSLLLAIADGRTAYADESWDEYASSKYYEDPVLTKLVESRLKPHLPPSMGGLGRDMRFVLEDVEAWWKRQLAPKKVIRPPSRWSEEMEELKREDARTSACYLVPNAKYNTIMKKIREPYVGLPEWTEEGKEFADLEVPPEGTLRDYFNREVWKIREGLSALTVPARVELDQDWLLRPIKQAPGCEFEDELHTEWVKKMKEEYASNKMERLQAKAKIGCKKPLGWAVLVDKFLSDQAKGRAAKEEVRAARARSEF
jgi:hypothetical protein